MTHAQCDPFIQGHDRKLGEMIVSHDQAGQRRQSGIGFRCANFNCQTELMANEILYVCRQGTCGTTRFIKRQLWCFDCGSKDPSS